MKPTIVIALILTASSTAVAQIDTSLFAGMEARSIGPSGMSGNVSSTSTGARAPPIW